MTVSKKMAALVTSALLGILLLAVVGLYQMGRVFEAANFANINSVPALVALDDIRAAVLRLQNGVAHHILAADPARIASSDAQISQSLRDAKAALTRYEPTIADAKDRELFNHVQASLAQYEALLPPILTASRSDQHDKARDLETQSTPAVQKLNTAIDEHVKYNIELGQAASDEAQASRQSARNMSVLIALFTLATVSAIGLYITRSLLRQLGGEPEDAARLARLVASGDLTGQIAVQAGDEGSLMVTLKDMQDSLAAVVGTVRQGSESVAAASTQIAQGNRDLSGRTEEQASALEETASSMEQLTTAVKQNADNARQANQFATNAASVASKGGQVVSQVVETMDSINASSRKIVDIISVIDGIAFQTNILALNAAVEAARAGEQGRGFAVVASEVRNLAQRSATAAKEIKLLIADSVSQVDIGSKLVEEAGTTMQEIVTSIQRVAGFMSDITAASSEQSAGIEQVNRAIIEMDNTTQQNSALVEEASAAAQSLQEQAASLAKVVSVFKLERQQHQQHKQHTAVVQSIPRHKSQDVTGKPMSAIASTRSQAAVRQISNARTVASNDWEEF